MQQIAACAALLRMVHVSLNTDVLDVQSVLGVQCNRDFAPAWPAQVI